MVNQDEELAMLVKEYNQLREKNCKKDEIRELRRKIRHLKYGFMSKLGSWLYGNSKKTGQSLSKYANNLKSNMDSYDKRQLKYVPIKEEDYLLR